MGRLSANHNDQLAAWGLMVVFVLSIALWGGGAVYSWREKRSSGEWPRTRSSWSRTKSGVGVLGEKQPGFLAVDRSRYVYHRRSRVGL